MTSLINQLSSISALVNQEPSGGVQHTKCTWINSSIKRKKIKFGRFLSGENGKYITLPSNLSFIVCLTRFTFPKVISPAALSVLCTCGTYNSCDPILVSFFFLNEATLHFFLPFPDGLDGSSAAGLRSDPCRPQLLNPGTEEELLVQGYAVRYWRVALLWVGYLCTGGLLWLLLYWVPREGGFRMSLSYCTVEETQSSDGAEAMLYLLFDVMAEKIINLQK